MENLGLAAPEMFLLGAICLILVGDLFVSDERKPLTYGLSQIALIVTLILTWWVSPDEGAMTAFAGSFIMDQMSGVLKAWILVVSIGVFLYSRDFVNSHKITNGEYYTLALSGVLGMMIMVSSSTMLTLYLGLELLSLSLYAMVALKRADEKSSEAAMKYFVLGALASGALLYGISMIYGATGSLHFNAIATSLAGDGQNSTTAVFGLAFVVVGIAFKFGAAPFHMWVPDVYEGAPTSVALYISAAPKIAAFALAIRFLVDGLETAHGSWQGMLILLSLLSIVIGNVLALSQVSVKRMLAYSTISHVGFIFLGILAGNQQGYSASMFYAITYSFTSLGAFGVLLAMDRSGVEVKLLTDLRGLFRRSPIYAVVMLLLVSMTGVPPTVGFYAKLAVLSAAVKADLVWLAVIAVIFSVIGAFYYLRVIKYMFFDDPVESQPVLAPMDVQLGLTINGAAIILFGIFPGLIMAACVAAFGL